MIRAIYLVVLASACHREPAVVAGSGDDLALYLQGVARGDATTRAHEVTAWIIDEKTWREALVDPYRDLWPEYVRGFDAAVPRLVEQLGTGGEITTRRHYAGDPRLTPAQGRLRWAEPVLAVSYVAELGGTPIDTVFLFDGTHWRVLAGLDEIMMARVRSRDRDCATLLERAGPRGQCTEVGWVIADAALRDDDVRFARSCKLAATLCGNRSP